MKPRCLAKVVDEIDCVLDGESEGLIMLDVC